MVRMQLQVTEEQLQALQHLSRLTGQSLSELVRTGIDQYLAANSPTSTDRFERAMGIAGRYASGHKDVSRNHDEHLASAFEK